MEAGALAIAVVSSKANLTVKGALTFDKNISLLFKLLSNRLNNLAKNLAKSIK